MSPAFFIRMLLRESRGSRGRLAFFVACLSVGVAAVVAVAGLSGSLDDGIRGEARQLLAADLAIEGRRPIPQDLGLAAAGLADAERTDLQETVTVVAAPPRESGLPGPSQLVELKVVSGDYPFYGKLVIEPARPLRQLLAPGTTVVAAELLARLGLRTGDSLRIGGQPFRIAGIVLSEPDRISVSMTLGPRVFLSADGFRRAGLTGAGSRIEYRTLLKAPEGFPLARLDEVKERLQQTIADPDFYRVETYRDAQPALRRSLARVERFLGLVALLSLFVGGIGVAQSVRAWLASRMDAIAILKCLGMRPREIFPLYLGQTALLGLAGSLVGIAVGVGIQLALPSLFSDLIPAELIRPWQPAALLRGLVLGVGVAVLFSLPPLSAVLRVPPSRVLRRDAEPLPGHRWTMVATGLALALGVWTMAALQARSGHLGGLFTGGVAAATLALALGALAVTRLVRRLPRESLNRPWLRHGVASLARPGATTFSAIVALGLGVLVVLGMSLVQRRLTEELAGELPREAPSAFLIDVQPQQWAGIEQVILKQGATRIQSVPVVMARIAAIDGRPVEELAERDQREEENRGHLHGGGGRREGENGQRAERWALTREQRLTYMRTLPEDNEVVDGVLWGDPQRAEVSVEQDFANDLGLRLGSAIRFDVQGVPLELTVTSLRTVNWRTFGINFFLVVEPGVLEDAPQQRLAAFQLPRGTEQRVQDELAARYPNVTLLRIREILDKIVQVMERIGLGIRFLGGFTVLAGIAILAGAVSAGSLRRGREVALLKTLGMTRRAVLGTFAVEYALIGLVAAGIGATGGTLLAWGVLKRGFELSWSFQPLPFLVAIFGAVLLAVAAGVLASVRAIERRPIEVLREQ
jgi:putative ABC transport system permease protein